jgi:hypothetical protein
MKAKLNLDQRPQRSGIAALSLMLAALAWMACLAPVRSPGQAGTAVGVISYPRVVNAGREAEIHVRLVKQVGHNAPQGVRNHLEVVARRHTSAYWEPEPSVRMTVQTDEQGYCVIRFKMPPKFRGKDGEVGTAVNVWIGFAGDAHLLKSHNGQTNIHIGP